MISTGDQIFCLNKVGDNTTPNCVYEVVGTSSKYLKIRGDDGNIFNLSKLEIINGTFRKINNAPVNRVKQEVKIGYEFLLSQDVMDFFQSMIKEEVDMAMIRFENSRTVTTAHTLNFTLRKDKQKKNGDCPIEMSYSIRGKRLFASLGISLRPAHWDPTTKRAFGVSDHPRINGIMDNAVKLVSEIEMEISSSGEKATPNKVMQAFKERFSNQENPF